jgi:hypothetical protein
MEIPGNDVDEDCDNIAQPLPTASTPAPQPELLDADADGVNRPKDCDDANAAINPGATDTPGNNLDENCDGADAPYPRLRSQVRMPVQWKNDSRSLVLSIEVTDLPRGSVVAISCKTARKGCPFKGKRLTAVRTGKWLLKKPFKNRWLPAGTRIEIRVSRPDAIGPAVTYVMKVRKVPKRTERCVVPGVKAPTPC